LKGIVIPASFEMIRTSALRGCRSLSLVAFESGSVLREIGISAFVMSRLINIVVVASVAVISESAFFGCRSLSSVTCESGSVLRKIEKSAFVASGFQKHCFSSIG
jgi:hypothetical protein